jgi:histidinol-phosphate aminotransferase
MRISRRTLLRRISAGAAAMAGAARGGSSSSVAANGGAMIRLDIDDNPYGPSPRAIAAMRRTSSAQRYDAREEDALRHRIAAIHRVTPDHIVLGCGTSEVLRISAEAFAGAQKKVVVARPTFESTMASLWRGGANIVEVPLRNDYAHDLDAMLSSCDASTGLIYVCNPNNPTGSMTRRQELDAFLGRTPATVHVLVDEAYGDYLGGSSEYASLLNRRADDRRVIVARTFSSIHGLADLHIGYAVAAPETAERLVSRRRQQELSAGAAQAAIAALDDVDHVRTSARRNADDRQEFFNQANARMLRAIDSQTNFVMLNTASPAIEIVEHFRRHHILVSGAIPSFDKYIRVSIGTPSAMREFWRVWDLLPHQMSM